jgi:hypothetical protein
MYWTKPEETHDKCGENVSVAYTNYIASPWFSGNITYSSLVSNPTPSRPVNASDRDKSYVDSNGCVQKERSRIFGNTMYVVGFSGGAGGMSWPPARGSYVGNNGTASASPISIASLSPVLGTKRVTETPQSVTVSNYVTVDAVTATFLRECSATEVMCYNGRFRCPQIRKEWERLKATTGCDAQRQLMVSTGSIQLNDAEITISSSDFNVLKEWTSTVKIDTDRRWQVPSDYYFINRTYRIYVTPTLSKATSSTTSSVGLYARAPGGQKTTLAGVKYRWKMEMGATS